MDKNNTLDGEVLSNLLNFHEHSEHNGHNENSEHNHTHEHSNTKAVSNRLAKAVGHLDSVKKMVDRGESCTDVLTQLIAVRSAINNAAKIIIVDHLNECIVDAAKNDDLEKIAEFEKIIKSFVK